MSDNTIEPNYLIVTNPKNGWKTPVSWDVVLKAADLDGYTIITDHRRALPKFDPSTVKQHPGHDCCDSCIEDAAHDSSYSTWPQCCCRSEIPIEWLESRMEGTR